jgi:phosphoribosylformimino-5-aminoimidazole carboxamide ribotide isomerase
MLLIPAIDIKGEHCVRLIQGDFQKKTIYSDDPVSQARKFVELGARMLHVVDLDGAFEGHPVNYKTIIALAENISVPIEVGGGIRSAESFEKYAEHGLNRIIVGTAALESSFDDIIKEYKDKVVVSIDVHNGKVVTHGGKKVSDLSVISCINDLQKKGVNDIIYKDFRAEGMLSGPNFDDIEEILTKLDGVELIASGGISSLDDIKRLKEYESRGLNGFVIGRAIYEGLVDVQEALKLCK